MGEILKKFRGNQESKINFSKLKWTKYVVGLETRPEIVHSGDTAAWEFENATFYSKVTGVTREGIVSVNEGSFSQGLTIKINCPGGKGHHF